MENELGQAVEIIMDLIITALLIGVIATFAFVSYRGYNIKLQHEAIGEMIRVKTDLYEFDNKIVSGYDVLDAICTYVRLYKFEVVMYNDVYTISAENESDTDRYGDRYGLRLWSDSHIRSEVLRDNIFSNFKSELLKDSSGEVILGVRFIQEEAGG